MGKIGGLALLSAFVLAGCTAPVAQDVPSTPAVTAEVSSPKSITKDGQAFDTTSVSFNSSAVDDFAAAAASIPGYSKTSADALAVVGRDLCEHYAGGFTTEDLRAASLPGYADSTALLGEAAMATVCSTP
ncbi:hypothetical protein AB0N65_11850 [Paenarthrobacter sp. NPDC089322]|uniref:hypothetical protein n=1 Tax=Paenarthrobacter sp. NPDC089322 TaxID=3155065 RepID=UPI0034272EEC